MDDLKAKTLRNGLAKLFGRASTSCCAWRSLRRHAG
jgi:hypothetical protein